jgi:predicted enzyme related to lactoylglutathione lyase
MSNLKGRFVWYDLMTTDPVAAQSFYTKAIGWTTEKFAGPLSMDYTMWKTARAPIGGVMQLPEEAVKMGAPPHWLAYIGTPDIVATVAQATELGAKVYVPTTDIPTVGRFAVLADPQGAAFAVFQPNAEQPGGDGTGLGEFSWHELYTTDPVAAYTFYSTLFGWEKTTAMDMGAMGTYQMYGQAGKSYGGMMKKPAEMPAPSHWNVYVNVDSADFAANRIRELGGKILNGPMDVPAGGRIVQALDPQGAAFSVYSEVKK